MNDFWIIIFGLLGCTFYWRVKKRKFDRTNEFGAEQFESYWNKVSATFVDEILYLGGIGLFSACALMLAFKYLENWVWLIATLLIAFAIEELFYRDRKKMGHVKIIR